MIFNINTPKEAKDNDQLANISCVYFLKFSNNSFYIGSTKMLRKRWKSHSHLIRYSKHFNSRINYTYSKYKTLPRLYYIECDERDRKKIEQEFISKYFNNAKCLNIAKRVDSPATNKSIPIHQYDLNGTYIRSYVSITEGADSININTSFLSSYLKGKGKTCGGYLWSYNRNDIPKLEYSDQRQGNLKYWICKYSQSGAYIEKYKNCIVANIAHGLPKTNTSIYMALKFPEKTAVGFKWIKVYKGNKIPESIQVGRTNNKYFQVKQLTLSGELLQVFNCAKEASRQFSNRKASIKIHEVCQGKTNSYNKYKWEYGSI